MLRHHPVRVSLAAVLALALLALAGCSSGGDGGGGATAAPVKGATEVTAKDVKFTPAAIEVPVGTTVTWRFADGSVPHDVTADGFSSGKPQTKGTFAHTFAQAGTYTYKCSVHPKMTGEVIVTQK